MQLGDKTDLWKRIQTSTYWPKLLIAVGIKLLLTGGRS